MKRLAWLSFLVLGPVTGPLLALSLVSYRAHRPILAASCLAGIALFWLGAPAVLAGEIALIRAH